MAIFLVSLMVFVAFAASLALSEWAATHLVRTRLQREEAFDHEYAFDDPFERDEL